MQLLVASPLPPRHRPPGKVRAGSAWASETVGVTSGFGSPSDGAGEDPTRSSWQPLSADPVVSRPATSLGPGDIPAGGDLRLDIGWDAFEQLVAAIARHTLGLNQIRFRRYGVPGQFQHGIDLAGRRPDGDYAVVQCKDVTPFTAASLRAAVEKFASARRPFNARHFILAVSHPDARTTQVEEELAALQDEYRDEFRLDLWGPQQLNDVLRERADIVARFWTRETAATFCTGAPLPGVAAPAPEWTRVADQVLLSPLGVNGLDRDLAEADLLHATDPVAAAEAYGQIAKRLAAEGFGGHAHVIWHRQLDALAAADDVDAACALAAELAALALHEGDLDRARRLSHRLDIRVGRHPDPGATARVEPSAAAARHAEVIRAAIYAAEHPFGGNTPLLQALRGAPAGVAAPQYQPILVLLLAELAAADAVHTPIASNDGSDQVAETAPDHDAALHAFLTAALDQAAVNPTAALFHDLVVRLRMARARYDGEECTRLFTEARQLRLPRAHAALVLAAQARRDAMAGSADDALEHWRQAVAHAIHDGRTDDASGWLYAIRGVHIQFGPWTDNIDEEHLLAQALPRSTSGRIIRRVRDPENDARRAALDDRPIEAIRSARRWLADSIVTGDWVDERAAVELLADLYAANAEPDRAALCYQWVGQTKKLVKLAEAIGDHLLRTADLRTGPWWQHVASLALIAAQRDLVPDDTASQLLTDLLDLVARGRAGELVEGPTGALTTQATKTACLLAARGNSNDALALLEMLSNDVHRQENQYQFHDKEHVQACQDIAAHHPDLASVALERLLDLADVGTHDALNALNEDNVLNMLRDAPSPAVSPSLTAAQREHLTNKLQAIAAAGRYDAGIAVAALGGASELVTGQAVKARDGLLAREEPDGHSFSIGTSMVPDSYLVTFLSLEDRRACLEKVLTVAEDRREAAPTRQEALRAVGNLVIDQCNEIRTAVHLRSRPYVEGEEDGSSLDAETTHPHPLSAMKINFGSPSLQPEGLRLAHLTAVTDDEKHWVRDRAVAMLRSSEQHEVHRAAAILARLPADILGILDPALLAGHPSGVVRQLAVVAAMAEPSTYASTLRALAADRDPAVRILLAARLTEMRRGGETGITSPNHKATVDSLLAILASDVRHSVRRAAGGFDDA